MQAVTPRVGIAEVIPRSAVNLRDVPDVPENAVSCQQPPCIGWNHWQEVPNNAVAVDLDRVDNFVRSIREFGDSA